MKVEIFTMGKNQNEKVGCSSCPKSCASRDQAVVSPQILKDQLGMLYQDRVEVIIYDYSVDDQERILARQNELFKENGVKRIVNKFLIGPLAPKIWPSVVVDGKIKSEGVLLDASQLTLLIA